MKINSSRHKKEGGFTLLELLIVIGVIAILAGIVVVAINPGRQFSAARNAHRWSGVNAMTNVVWQYVGEHGGSFPPTITDTMTEICRVGAATCSGYINLNELIEKEYTSTFPIDPNCSACADCNETNGTGYWIRLDDGRLEVKAECAELDVNIEVGS